MTPKERMLAALDRQAPDRLPATVHQWQTYHLDTYLDGMDALEAFRHFGLDPAIAFWAPLSAESPDWRDEATVLRDDPQERVVRHTITTPDGTLSYETAADPMTCWITEPPIARPEDIHLIEKHMPVPTLDKDAVAAAHQRLGDDGILRGFLWGDQGGAWQHACCLVGTEELILAAQDEPDWVHRLLQILTEKKMRFIDQSLDGARFDLVETGGGAGSSTVISPQMHREFCFPYDRQVHTALHTVGQKVVYHTCGGMMPLLETIAENKCDAAETLSPPEVGGDVTDPGGVKRRIGGRLALIGGLNQHTVLTEGTPADVRAEVHRLFEAAGPGGGYICSPCDHFFDAPIENLHAYADAAKECVY